MSEDRKIVKGHCNSCVGITKHLLIAERMREVNDRDEETGRLAYYETTKFEMLECCGCENISLRRTFESLDLPCVSIDYFPPAVSRRLPRWLGFHRISQESIHFGLSFSHEALHGLFCEVYSALHSGNLRLAMMGARAILDMAMTEKLGDKGGFAQKLGEFEKRGFVCSRDRRILETALEAGHAAVHRGHAPTALAVDQVMDIAEHLVEAVYVLDKVADGLKKSTPPREKGGSEAS